MAISNLVDATDFTGDASLILDAVIGTQQDLEALIPKVQESVLLDALGYSLYNEFDLGLQQPTPEQKWIDLRDGATFTNSDYNFTCQYAGLKDMVKYFVYYEYLKNIASLTTGVGEAVPKAVNANIDLSGAKRINGWNKAIKLYGFPFNDADCAYTSLAAPNSLYNFIYYTNKAAGTNVYNHEVFTAKNYKNHLL